MRSVPRFRGRECHEDDINYHVQATNSLSTYPLEVSEITGAEAATLQAGLPALNAGWEYRTFRAPGDISTTARQFMRVRITD